MILSVLTTANPMGSIMESMNMSETIKAVRTGTKRDITITAIEANPTKTVSEVAAIMMESGKFSGIYDARGYYNYMVKHGFVSITEVVKDAKKPKAERKAKTTKTPKQASAKSNSSELSVEEFRARVAGIRKSQLLVEAGCSKAVA